MLAKRVGALPDGDGFVFEPKWDGFRVIAFRDGDELLLQSRDEKPLDRYFPELRAPLLAQLPPRCVLDGEIVIARDGALDFEALQQRIHPAASRVARLAQEPTRLFKRYFVDDLPYLAGAAVRALDRRAREPARLPA